MPSRRRKAPNDYRQSAKGRRAENIQYTTNATQTSPRIIKSDELLVLIKRIPPKDIYRRLKTDDNQKSYRQQPILKDKRNYTATTTDNDEHEKCDEDNGSSENDGIESPASKLQKRSDALSRLPHNYDHFAKPITNNEHVNSTLDNVSIDRATETRTTPTSKICSAIYSTSSHCVSSIKPRPKCKKMRNCLLPPSLECNRIPILLAATICHENPSSASPPSLSPIVERTGEYTRVLEKESPSIQSATVTEMNNLMDIANFDNFELDLYNDNIAVPNNVRDDSSLVRSIENLTSVVNQHVDSNDERIVEGTCEPIAQHENDNSATMITAKRRNGQIALTQNADENVSNDVRFTRHNTLHLDENNDDPSRPTDNGKQRTGRPPSSSSSSNGRQNRRKRRKCIMIEADTVHIHNHFYNR